MRILATQESVTKLPADAIVVGVYDEGVLAAPAAAVNAAIGGVVGKMVDAESITGSPGEVTLLHHPAGLEVDAVAVVGMGPKKRFDRGAAFVAAGAAAKTLSGKRRKHVGLFLEDGLAADVLAAAVAGAQVGCHGADLYRKEKNQTPFATLSVGGAEDTAVGAGEILGTAVNVVRRLVNEPASVIYPQSFADEAAEVAQAHGLEIEVWDEHKLADERCGALLAVGQGSVRPPRLVILRHRGGGPNDPTIALVGKGVTFDSGGLSLKPSENMLTMKMDMSGAATVLGAMQAIARLQLPVNVIGLMGLVENMPGGGSYKLGDVLTAKNGKTIEVHNTDAEGRLVLADTLCVAVEQGASKIVDLATLTGACMVALGRDVAGVMSNDEAWQDEVLAAAKTCGEPAWPLPMFPEIYDEQIKSPVADIKNVGDARWGGAITAAKLLQQFVGDTPWTHIDIAGPAFIEKPKPHIEGGASGCFVRTLVELVNLERF